MIIPLQIAKRFNGPPNSGNGGYTAGLMASKLAFDAEITLRSPPPLAQVMQLHIQTESAALMYKDVLVADAKVIDFQLTIPPAVTWAEAETAALQPQTFDTTIFSSCFVCGSARKKDGLSICPGAVGPQQVAGPWIPHEDLGDENGQVKTAFIWSALDCPGAWAMQDSTKLVLLGRMATKVIRSIKINQSYIVMGWVIKEDGRKTYTGTAIYDNLGEVHAFAKATWISVKQ